MNTASFSSGLAPDECRARLAAGVPPPPRLGFRFGGRREIAGKPSAEGGFTVWEVPSGFASPVYDADVRLSPSPGGTQVDMTFRTAWARMVRANAFTVLVMSAALVAVLVLTLSQRREAPIDLSTNILALVVAYVVAAIYFSLIVAAGVRYLAWRRSTIEREFVTRRLREILGA